MKKVILALLLVFGTALTLQAQSSFKTDIMNFLREEGYAPTVNDDGYISFKMQENSYASYIQETGDEFAFVKITTAFRMETLSYTELLEIANELNHRKFGCNCSVFMAGGNPIFQIAMEFVTASRANSEFQIKYTMPLMRSWIDEFEDIIADK